MRPLTHLGIGISSSDYDLYQINESLYDELSKRGEDILETAKKDFMKDYYNNFPLPTKSELLEIIDYHLINKEKLLKMGAPPTLVNIEDEIIVKAYNDIQTKNYGILSDLVYKKYRVSFFDKLSEWENSNERIKLCNEIYSYNEDIYNKIKDDQYKEFNDHEDQGK